eukprot:385894-Pelagomonas_calceolata.AAC.5
MATTTAAKEHQIPSTCTPPRFECTGFNASPQCPNHRSNMDLHCTPFKIIMHCHSARSKGAPTNEHLNSPQVKLLHHSTQRSTNQ